MNIQLLSQTNQNQILPSKRKWFMAAFIICIFIIILIMHFKKNAPSPPQPKLSPIEPPVQIKVPPKNLSIRWAGMQKLNVDFNNISIAEALRQLAKVLKINMVVNSSLRGKTSLHWHEVQPIEALHSFIRAEHLKSWQENNIWYVTTEEDWMRHQNEEMKMQKMLNETAPTVMRLWQIHYARAEDIAKVITDSHHSLLSKRGMIRVDQRTNMVCIQDLESHISELHHLIERLDVPVQQVLIEAHLASIDSDYEKDLGIQFVLGSAKEKGIHTGPYSLAVATLADGSLLNVRLAALENRGHAELISNPILFTENLQTASIESGEEIPYQESNENGGTSVAFKKAVLSLKVTPQIMSDHHILLDLQVNQDKPSRRMVLGVPAIDTRQVSTHIMIKDGQTIILGGIYETNKENALQRNPFLDKIPLVGSFLSQQNGVERKRELLIFVTLKIIQ